MIAHPGQQCFAAFRRIFVELTFLLGQQFQTLRQCSLNQFLRFKRGHQLFRQPLDFEQALSVQCFWRDAFISIGGERRVVIGVAIRQTPDAWLFRGIFLQRAQRRCEFCIGGQYLLAHQRFDLLRQLRFIFEAQIVRPGDKVVKGGDQKVGLGGAGPDRLCQGLHPVQHEDGRHNPGAGVCLQAAAFILQCAGQLGQAGHIVARILRRIERVRPGQQVRHIDIGAAHMVRDIRKGLAKSCLSMT